MTDADIRQAILTALAPHTNTQHGKNRYNTPWRPGADGGTLAVHDDPTYGLGLKWYDHKTLEGGNGITLAQRLGIPLSADRPATPKGAYADLAAYAAAHGVPVDVFEQAGWHEVRRGRNHLAFAFPTTGGMRYRYADEVKAGRKFDHDKGTARSWYGLDRAVKMAQGGALYLCNGEPSTLVAQHHGVPAACVTGGEQGSISEELTDELREAYDGPIVVAYDCDDQGRRTGPALATHLRALGFQAYAIDLNGSHGFDLADFCRLHEAHSAEALLKCNVISAPAPKIEPMQLVEDWRRSGMTAAQLQYAEFPPELWVVESILPSGACLLAAKPKRGKSWLALQAAICVAMKKGFLGKLQPTQGRVLYLDLEGTQRRIKKRLRAMIGANREPWPDNLHIFTEWPQGPEALEQLESWLIAYPDTRLVIIDVLASFRRPMEMKESYYQYDRETVKPINDLLERHDCAGILVHHMNKSRAEDVFDTISGSTGLMSVTNTQWVMGAAPDDRNVTIFSMQGRDLENTDAMALRWDDYAHMHKVEGSAAELTVSVERKSILAALSDDEPRTPKEIAEIVGKPVNAVKQLLHKMLNDGQVDKAGYGQWVLVRGNSGNSDNSGNSGNSGNSSVSEGDVKNTLQELSEDGLHGNSLIQGIGTQQNDTAEEQELPADSYTVTLGSEALGSGKTMPKIARVTGVTGDHSALNALTPAERAAQLRRNLEELKQRGLDNAAD